MGRKITLINGWFKVSDGKVMIDSAGEYGAGLALEVIGWKSYTYSIQL